MTKLAIIADRLSKWFGEGEARTCAVKEASFEALWGEMLYIVGPSGSGKTTLLSMISGILRPNSGSVSIDGRDLWSLSDDEIADFRLKRIGFVFQDYHLFLRLTTAENVAIPLILQKRTWDEALRAAARWLEVVGLGGKTNFLPNKLSGGEQQRVAIARAIVHQPEILVFDDVLREPEAVKSRISYMPQQLGLYEDLTVAENIRFYADVGDEGGFAPRLKSNEEACELIVEAIQTAGYRPGVDVAIALDPGASSFCEEGKYRLSRSGQGEKTSAEMTALYRQWIGKYPIVSLEDGLAESDWDGFREQTAALGDKVQIVGDDNLVTNPRFISRAIREKTCNAALIELNQIGTVTETIEAVDLCRKGGWGFVVSHRSGETEDTFIADFAVAKGGGQIKTGSVCRGERIAKYNRLLEIEHELGQRARFGR